MRPDLQLTFDMVFTSEEYGGPAGTPFDGDVNGYTSFVGTPFVDDRIGSRQAPAGRYQEAVRDYTHAH